MQQFITKYISGYCQKYDEERTILAKFQHVIPSGNQPEFDVLVEVRCDNYRSFRDTCLLVK